MEMLILKYRICEICKIEKPLNKEFFKKNVSHGNIRYHYSCKECDNIKLKENHWKNDKLKCFLCNDFFEEIFFDKNGNNLHRNGRDRRCKKCKSKNTKKNRESKIGKEAINRLVTERWLGAKNRAKKNLIKFEITKEDIKNLLILQDFKCAISNVKLTFEIGNGRVPTNISIDRIDSNKGYIKNNIQIVCMAINQMKNDLTIEELIYFCKNIIKNNENKK